jgi:hypothetical protein
MDKFVRVGMGSKLSRLSRERPSERRLNRTEFRVKK